MPGRPQFRVPNPSSWGLLPQVSDAGRRSVPGKLECSPRLKRTDTGSRRPPLLTHPNELEPSAGHRRRRGSRPRYPSRSPTCLEAEQEDQDAEETPGTASASHRGGCSGIRGPFHVPALAQVHRARQSRAPRAASAEQQPLLPAPSPCAPATPLLGAPPRLPSLFLPLAPSLRRLAQLF